MKKYFTIHSGDIGSEAFTDQYVEQLEAKCAELERERDAKQNQLAIVTAQGESVYRKRKELEAANRTLAAERTDLTNKLALSLAEGRRLREALQIANRGLQSIKFGCFTIVAATKVANETISKLTSTAQAAETSGGES